jgi:hypothetical protein
MLKFLPLHRIVMDAQSKAVAVQRRFDDDRSAPLCCVERSSGASRFSQSARDGVVNFGQRWCAHRGRVLCLRFAQRPKFGSLQEALLCIGITVDMVDPCMVSAGNKVGSKEAPAKSMTAALSAT